MKISRKIILGSAVALMALGAQVSTAKAADCDDLPSYEALTQALKSSVLPSGGESNGGLDLNMWGTIVNRDGEVCALTKTGADRGDQWPGSRVISAQKANTANAFSLPGLALSTANLFSAVQPGGSLFGLQFSNPVDTDEVYEGLAANYGQDDDPLVGKKPGGVNVFGGGLALYNEAGTLVGALGVSGDTSCADHNIAWKTRETLGLENVPGGVHPDGHDGIIYDITDSKSVGGFGHPTCGGTEDAVAGSIQAKEDAAPAAE